jgi:FdhD protein
MTPPPIGSPAPTVPRTAIRGARITDGPRTVPEETPVALTYNRATHAVMLATPADLEDFAIGFSLAEGIITTASDIEDLEIVLLPDGIEARMTLDPARLDALTRRQRRLAGPSGCGLCGLDSLRAAVRPVPQITATGGFTTDAVSAAMASLAPAQTLNHLTRGVHAAGFWTPASGLVAVREDVGRHNALDKLAGAMAREGTDARSGILLLSSRVSVEMVQKAALAIRMAEAAGITLIAIARPDGFEVFSHPDRITLERVQHVA